MSEVHAPVVIDAIPDRDGDVIEVSVLGAEVMLSVESRTDCVLLGADGQERFAQAYVAACRQAMVNAGTAKAVSADGR